MLNKLTFIVLFFTLFTVQSCQKKNMNSTKNEVVKNCDAKATVFDLRGEQGCNFILITDKNEQLLPLSGDNGFFYSDGQQVTISYTIAEKGTIPKDLGCKVKGISYVNLTCINQFLPDAKTQAIPQPKDCVDTTDPSKIKWMRDAIAKHNPFEIKKYKYLEDGFAYHFTGATNYLYDCQGLQICNTPGKMMNDCVRKVNSLGEGEVIWKRK